MPNYTYRAEYSPDYGAYVGVCLEFPSHVAQAPTALGAIEGIEKIVGDEVADLNERGAILPEPLTDRRYSGKFIVRTSPALHARLVVEANEQGVTLNAWVVQKLAGRNTAASIDDFF